MFHAETGADDVDVAHPAQILSLKIDDERGNLDACIVDQDVVATERGDGGCDSLFPLRVVGDVQVHIAGLGACFCKTAGGFLAEIGENVADHHGRAGIGKRLCDRSADASRAASDQSLAACQTFFTHRMLLPLRFYRCDAPLPAEPRGCARRRACCSLSAEKKLSADRNERRWCAACYCLPVRTLFRLQCLET